MSRIGRTPVLLPRGVEVSLEEGSQGIAVRVKGPRGELSRTFHPVIAIQQEAGQLTVNRPSDARQHRALHGLSRTLLNNMVVGVTEGFRKSLELQGVGYRAQTTSSGISLALGYTHPVEFDAPAGISFQVEANTRIHVEGIDKELVGQTAARIRATRPPNVYTGKGVRYLGEVVRRKAGKGAGRKR